MPASIRCDPITKGKKGGKVWHSSIPDLRAHQQYEPEPVPARASKRAPSAGSDRAILMVHGLWTCRSCECSDRFLEIAKHLYNAGYNILLIDLRRHGESGGDQITFGQHERWDEMAAWIGWNRRG